MGSWKGRGNWYIQLVKVLCCKLPANDQQLPAHLRSVREVNPDLRGGRREWPLVNHCCEKQAFYILTEVINVIAVPTLNFPCRFSSRLDLDLSYPIVMMAKLIGISSVISLLHHIVYG